jgi:hypothetical protein
LLPIKWDSKLKVSGLNTEVILMKKCCAKNSIKKIPESAIATFLAIDDFNNADCAIRFNNLFYE